MYGQITVQESLWNPPPLNQYFQGQSVSYKVVVTNVSSSAITNIVLTDVFSAQFVSGSINTDNMIFPITTFTAIGNTLTVNMATLPYNGSATFFITVQINNPNPCGTFSNGGTLSNSVTITNSSVGGGFTGSANATITAPTNVITLPNGAFSSAYSSALLPNSFITINGDFIIDNNISLTNCVFNMASNSEIRILKGSLSLNLCHLYSCGALWKGIHAISGNLAQFRYSRIEDAENAVFLENNMGVLNGANNAGSSICWIQNSRFMNNYIGLYVAPPIFNSINAPSNYDDYEQ